MLDSMFQGETDQTLDDLAARPVLPSPTRPSFAVSSWNTTAAPFKGVGAGANQVAATWTELLKGYSAAATYENLLSDPSNLVRSDEEVQKRKEAAESLRNQIGTGEAFQSDLADEFRSNAQIYMPDPATSNAVENTLFGLTRFGTKALGYSFAAGPLPGAVLTGTDEGMTEADRLKHEGVDIKTRAKAGAVVGAASGLATVLPLAGATKLQTAGLVAAGGPGAFVAQQAAAKAILENAGYDQIASQYDPFDPVGLAVSTLIPAAFGAHGYRANARARANAEAVAAARVQQLQEQIAASGLHDPTDVVGAEQHVAAVAKASDQMAAGEKVNVSDVLNAERIVRAPPIEVHPLPVEEAHAPQLSDDERAVEARFAEHVDANGEALAEAYLQQRGAVIDPDIVKTFSEDYAADPVKYTNAVHEPSSKLAKLIYAKALQTIKPGDHVLFTAGGGGSGKSESLDRHLASGEKPAVIYDSTLSSIDSASKRIDQALEAGAKVDILYTNRQVEKAFEFSLSRSQVVPHDVLAKAHVGASDTIRALAEKYKGNPNVDIRIMNNLTDSLADIKPGKLADVPKYNYNDIERGLYENAQRKLESGAISQERFDLTVRRNRNRENLGSSTSSSRSQPENNVRGTGGHRGSDHGGTPESQSLAKDESGQVNSNTDGKSNSTPSILDTQTAELLRQSPDMMVQLEGMDAPMRLADALEAVKAEAAKDAQDAPLLQVAAECFLRSA